MNRRLPLVMAALLTLTLAIPLIPLDPTSAASQSAIGNQRPGERLSRSNTVIRRLSDDQLEEYLDELGYEAEEVEPSTYRFEMNGVIVLLFQGEINLQLYAGFTQVKDLEHYYNMPRLINEWNRTKRFSRAYLDFDGDACIESDLDLEGGVTFLAIDEFLRTFAATAGAFAAWLEDPEEPADNRALRPSPPVRMRNTRS